MKRGIIFLLSLFFIVHLIAQHIPMGINYQAIARDNAGNELKNKNLSIRISILSGNASGNVEYAESHAVTTDPFGLFKLVIGEGSFYSGSVNEFSEIEWGAAAHFLKVEVNFGDGFISMGTMPFQAVPYALYSANSGSSGGAADLDKDPTNELQMLSLDGSTLSISNGNSVTLNDIFNDADSDPQNELQDLRLEGNLLRLSPPHPDPTTINLQPYLDNTDNQQLMLDKKKNLLSITNGNTVEIDADTTNELQQLTRTGYDLNLSRNGGTVNIKPEIIAFRAVKTPLQSQLLDIGRDYDLIFKTELLDTGKKSGYELGYYNEGTGVFTVPPEGEGLYFFEVNYDFNTSHSLRIMVNSELYETIFDGYGVGVSGIRTYSFILMLEAGDFVNINLLNQTLQSFSGSGTFMGYRIH